MLARSVEIRRSNGAYRQNFINLQERVECLQFV